MGIIIPKYQDGNIIRLQKTEEEIKEQIDKIYKSWLKYQSDFGFSGQPILILNEDDYRFINQYMLDPANRLVYGVNGSGFSGLTLFGMKVLKMKAKGFVFAYE